MKNYAKALMLSTVFAAGLNAQTQDQMTKSIMDETYNNSQLEKLAYELLDGIGPRLVGSPKMQQSHDWAVTNSKVGESMPATNSGANGNRGKEELLLSKWYILMRNPLKGCSSHSARQLRLKV